MALSQKPVCCEDVLSLENVCPRRSVILKCWPKEAGCRYSQETEGVGAYAKCLEQANSVLQQHLTRIVNRLDVLRIDVAFNAKSFLSKELLLWRGPFLARLESHQVINGKCGLMGFREMWMGDTRSREFWIFGLPGRKGMLQHFSRIARTLLALSPIMT